MRWGATAACRTEMVKLQDILPVPLTIASIKLLGSNSNVDTMACVDVKLFHSCYIGVAMPVFTCRHDCELCHNSLLPRHGAAIA